MLVTYLTVELAALIAGVEGSCIELSVVFIIRSLTEEKRNVSSGFHNTDNTVVSNTFTEKVRSRKLGHGINGGSSFHFHAL